MDHPGIVAQSPRDGRNATRGAAVPRPTADSVSMTDLPRSRLFEKRLPPGFRDKGSGHPRSLADKALPQDCVDRSPDSFAAASRRLQDDAQPVAAARSGTDSPLFAARTGASAQNAKGQQGLGPARSPANRDSQKQHASEVATTIGDKLEMKSSKNVIPSTTVRIGNYPSFEKANVDQKEIDAWNTAFRDTYGTLAADAAKKYDVPARLLAALSANEMAAENWTALSALADRNTLLTRSVGPLQISPDTALRYKLAPVDNDFYGVGKDDIWTALHDPDIRHGQPSPPSGLTPGQRLSSYRDNPYPNNPNGRQALHDYLDNPTTSFDAGAKLLQIYLQRLVDDYKSGSYLKYSAGFRGLIGLSSPNDPIHKDLNILASGDKDAILNLHFSTGLARALAMIWNNGENIKNVENFSTEAPNAYRHGVNMEWQQENQDDLIPAVGNSKP
jgi:hypothetical protein